MLAVGGQEFIRSSADVWMFCLRNNRQDIIYICTLHADTQIQIPTRYGIGQYREISRSREIMSFFTGTTKLVNTSPIPSSGPNRITKAAAVELLHDHAFFLKIEPHYVSHRPLPPTESSADAAAAKAAYQLPRDLEPLGDPAVKLYEVVDHVPNPVWSSSVVSNEEFVDFKDGLWVRIRSPLAVVMETRWTIRERKGEGEGEGEGGEKAGLELVEDVTISCSKLLLSIVKGQVDNNWREIHRKIAERLVDDAKKAEGSTEGEVGEAKE
ncbi:hypothetical protein F5Y11DRAFT_338273 [Daldinia sp. FL1419]|nr:hypothetical protein F5Y11DRAFT_338273 [Daldinia sp. FL1419]